MLVAVSVFGRDSPGIIHRMASSISASGANIVNLEQNILRGIFTMFIVADLSKPEKFFELESALKGEAHKLGLAIDINKAGPFSSATARKNLFVLTILGQDRPGLIAEVSNTVFSLGLNVERAVAVAGGDLFPFEMLINLDGRDPVEVRETLRKKAEELGVDLMLQSEAGYLKEKRLFVFDMDSTIVDAEIINELANAAGVGAKVQDITGRAMRGEMDFEAALRERVSLLKGTSIGSLAHIADSINLTPGAEELIRTLRQMGYKTCLVSGGFTYFSDKIKQKLGFDYSFANTLDIKEGVLTGKLKGRIVDAKRKGEIIKEVAELEGIPMDAVVAVGDGANDRLMLENAGLSVAFNAKEALKKVANGSINRRNLKALLYFLDAKLR